MQANVLMHFYILGTSPHLGSGLKLSAVLELPVQHGGTTTFSHIRPAACWLLSVVCSLLLLSHSSLLTLSSSLPRQLAGSSAWRCRIHNAWAVLSVDFHFHFPYPPCYPHALRPWLFYCLLGFAIIQLLPSTSSMHKKLSVSSFVISLHQLPPPIQSPQPRPWTAKGATFVVVVVGAGREKSTPQ